MTTTPKDDWFRPGKVVRTSYGVGVVMVRPTTEVEQVQVRLWRRPGQSIGTSTTAYLRPDAILGKLPVAPGMTTTTKESTPRKVLVHCYKASSNTFLVSPVQGTLVALPSIVTPSKRAKRNLKQKLAQTTSEKDGDDDDDDDFFDAADDGNNSNMDDEFDEFKEPELVEDEPKPDDNATTPKEPTILFEFQPSDLNEAPSAKFYPLLQELMNRGDATATQVGTLWNQNKDHLQTLAEQLQTTGTNLGNQWTGEAQQLVQQEMELIEADTGVDVTTLNASKATQAATTAVDEFKTTVQTSTPAAEQELQKVMAMLKDEELTVLLANGKQRLEQLVSPDYLPQATQQALDSLGVKWTAVQSTTSKHAQVLEASQKRALEAMDELLHAVHKVARGDGGSDDADEQRLTLQNLNWNELEAQVKELNLQKKFQVAFDGMVEASKSDRHLTSIMEQVTKHTTEWQQLTGRLLATKSGSLFMEGATRIQKRAETIFKGANAQFHSGTTDLTKWTESISHEFTKAFTEGDAAVARLKSIELGDAVRHRLVSAIEVRSESMGGLDGIIAGALGAVDDKTLQAMAFVEGRGLDNVGTDQVSALMTSLQMSATDATQEANETLLSVLSQKSVYRDVVLLKLEETFCDLEEQFFGTFGRGDDDDDELWSPEDLAAIARGEGGTAKLFEPIAKRAMKEIHKQLDAAEANVLAKTTARGGVVDKNTALMLEALKKVRKILSGEMNMNAIMDDVVNLLNDDEVVKVGEQLVQHGETVLDALEGVSSGVGNDPTNKMIADAMKVAKKAGITKDTVMAELEKIDMNEMLDTAQGAMTDEAKRRKLLSSATDAALDFFLKILPSMPVPPFEGVKDGLVYQFDNLSMEGFKVKKENIIVEIAGMRATNQAAESDAATRSTGDLKKKAKDMAPAATAGTPLSAPDSSTSIVEDDDSFHSENPETVMDIANMDNIGHVKATELLIIDIKDIAAVLDNANWSFEQTYFPYLKGKGTTDVRLEDGSVRLQFELRRIKRKIQVLKAKEPGDVQPGGEPGEEETEEKEIWEPVLCLHDRSCSIEQVQLFMQGEGKLAWFVNKASAMFKGPVGHFVARQVVNILSTKSGWILDKLNTALSPYWDLILSTAGLKMDDLLEADISVVTAAMSEEDENCVELVWRERLPLGLNLLLNDQSGQIKVVDLPRGSQARKVCESREMNPDIFKGATIVAVNGTKYSDPEDIYDALRDPGRPKTVVFRLAESLEAERVENFVAEAMSDRERLIKEAAATISAANKDQSEHGGENDEENDESQHRNANGRPKPTRVFETRTVKFRREGDLGIEFGESPDGFGLIVHSFLQAEDDTVLAAERSGRLQVGDLLTHINGICVIGENGAGREKAFQVLKEVGLQRPLTFTVVEPYLISKVLEMPTSDTTGTIGGPSELVLEEVAESEQQRRIVLTGFNDASGVAETGGIMIGDFLVFVNGLSVGAGARWIGDVKGPSLEKVYAMLRDESAYPLGMTFARPKQKENKNSWKLFNSSKSQELEDGDADTVCVTADRLDVLGCVFNTVEHTEDIVVTDFYAIPGYFQSQLKHLADRRGNIRLAIDAVNGQFVPSYVSKDMVKNAVTRSWNRENRVEILFCDDERKAWVHGLLAKEGEEYAEAAAAAADGSD